jgi:hypothetical protein
MSENCFTDVTFGPIAADELPGEELVGEVEDRGGGIYGFSGEFANGANSLDIEELTESWRNSGVGYDIVEDGEYGGNQQLIRWRPGMKVPLVQSSYEGEPVLDAGLLQEALSSEFPDAWRRLADRYYLDLPHLGEPASIDVNGPLA